MLGNRNGVRSFTLLALAVLVGCGDDGGAPIDASAPDRCTTDTECADETFCNGAERCRPDDADADARGCVSAATPVCDATQECIEADEACVPRDCADADADGDGHDSTACPGGDDCDDNDPNRYPGNTEVCDLEDHDEDCDPRTYGIRDLDSDGEPDALCCNTDGTDQYCGTDCDDSRSTTSPVATEACDGRDNDCDGNVDEDVLVTYTEDADGDDFGSDDPAAATMQACSRPEGYADNARDCDDTRSGVNPGLAEICDAAGLDENCDGMANPATLCACEGSETRLCMRPGICQAGNETCEPLTGTWGECSITGEPETCNGEDDDCDGAIDEMLLRECYPDEDDDGYAASGAVAMDVCPVASRSDVGNCPVDMTNRAPVGDLTDCDDTRGDRSPAVSDVCNGVDDDCDGMIDEIVSITCYADSDNDYWPAPSAPATRQCPAAGRGLAGGCPVGFTYRLPGDGADCNEGDPMINPGMTEICDPAPAADEDCDGLANPPADCMCSLDDSRSCSAPGVCSSGLETCTSGGTWGACSISPSPESCNGLDDDCNGTPDDGSGFICADGDTFGCTTSCANGGVPGSQTCAADCMGLTTCRAADEGSTAAGTCNGCDDDGDGAIDEGWTCRFGDTRACSTSCGTSGTQSCRPGCGGWDTCTAPEECNYCDDDRDGTTDDEAGLATSRLDTDFRGANVIALGDATRRTTSSPHVLHAYALSSVGGIYQATPIRLGHGTITFSATVEASKEPTCDDIPSGGWAIQVLLAGLNPNGRVGPASNYGISTYNLGAAAYWRFNDGSTNMARLAILNYSGGSVVDTTQERSALPRLGGTSCGATQTMVMTITPDSAGGVDTSHIIVHDGQGNLLGECTGASECGTTLRAGNDVYVGVTGANHSARRNRLYLQQLTTTLTVEGLCI